MHHQIFGPGNRRTSAALPAARTVDLIAEEIGGETVVYDQVRHEIHQLNPTALAVWRLSDGTRASHQISTAATSRLGLVVDEQAVRLAWTLLDDRHLLSEPLAPGMRVETRSRRSFLKGVLVAGAAAVPTIISTSAPKAAAAASQGCLPYNSPCGTGDTCCEPFVCTSFFDGFCTTP